MYNLNESCQYIELIDFNIEEEKLYKNSIPILINHIYSFVMENNIPYNSNLLNEKIKILKVYRKNGVCEYGHAKDDSIQVLHMKPFTERHTKYDQMGTLVHELIHFFVPHRNISVGISDKYRGFDEFLTEYLAFLICSKIYGKEFENYYIDNKYGHYNEKDHEFMSLIAKSVDFQKLLTSYFNNDVNLCEELIGVNTLQNIHKYYLYCKNLTNELGMPIRALEKELEAHELYRRSVNKYISAIYNGIEEIKKKDK